MATSAAAATDTANTSDATAATNSAATVTTTQQTTAVSTTTGFAKEELPGPGRSCGATQDEGLSWLAKPKTLREPNKKATIRMAPIS